MFFDMELGFPKLQEQKDIVEYIQGNNSKIEKAIKLQIKQIEKLKEYKTTLIDSVVTGKVKVL
jgi:type I restriction enzyme S subunit